ncbi:hypothetical protein AURDEDRAFT_181335 [Auricularia subglabra TFB-10046 SS5]|nr:hypothetical protein AURDEDRAFT_181335 [Auricularia subglabra TFB-10046 SS5]
MSQTESPRPPLQSWEQNLFPVAGLPSEKRARFHGKTASQPLQPPPPHVGNVDNATQNLLKNVLRSVPCAWPGCSALLNSLGNYARHLEKCHAHTCKSTLSFQTTALRASNGYHCKLRPCANQAYPNTNELAEHLKASHVRPLYLTCPYKDCGARCGSSVAVVQHLEVAHKTTPERLQPALIRPHTDLHDELPKLPRSVSASWTLTTPRIRMYHKDSWVPPPPRNASPEPLTPAPSTQSSSGEPELPPRRNVDFPHSYDYLVEEPLDLTPAPSVGTSFDSDTPPPPGVPVCLVRRIAEPDGRQLSAPLPNTFVPPPPREPTRSIYTAFRAKFERERPGELDGADADGDPDDWDGDAAESDWSFDGVTDDEPDDEDVPTPQTSRESTAAARKPYKRRKKRW